MLAQPIESVGAAGVRARFCGLGGPGRRVPSVVARRTLHDQYFKQAKREGYVARSAYKLLEIQDKHRLLKKGQRVLDLGCAPGSWLQVASPIVGPKGVLVGIDLSRVAARLEPNVRTIEGDAFDQKPEDLTEMAGGLFHAVLSDMAPNTTGSGDDLVSANLCREVFELAKQVGLPGSSLVMKILEGAEYSSVVAETREAYAKVKGFRPKATRDVSREIFIVAQGLRAGAGG